MEAFFIRIYGLPMYFVREQVRSEALPRRTSQGTRLAWELAARQVQRMMGSSGYLWPLVLVVVVSEVSVLVTVAGAARRTMTLLTTG